MLQGLSKHAAITPKHAADILKHAEGTPKTRCEHLCKRVAPKLFWLQNEGKKSKNVLKWPKS